MTESVLRRAVARIVTVTVSPDFAWNTAAVRSSAELIALPLKRVTTSPTFSPAFAAGEPLTIVVILRAARGRR